MTKREGDFMAGAAFVSTMALVHEAALCPRHGHMLQRVLAGVEAAHAAYVESAGQAANARGRAS